VWRTAQMSSTSSHGEQAKPQIDGAFGEFLVCAELGKCGLIATPFLGNALAFDVLAADDFCRTVPIQVKAGARYGAG